MTIPTLRWMTAAVLVLALSSVSGAALAQAADPAEAGSGPAGMPGTVRQISTHMGEMTMEAEGAPVEIDDSLRFEPYQQLEEMFLRDDVVFLMRHGPTDWSKRDRKDVAPTDCENQRVLSPQGVEDMRNLGTLMAANDVLPARIVVSEWCRGQQTLEYLLEGFDRVDPQIAAEMPIETDPDFNLLLSLQGAKTVTSLRDRIDNWNGDPDRSGPLLLISHYTNIEELTQFRVFEGEILVLDPRRGNEVLGYLRLRSAQPDVGHFADALASPLLDRERAFDMVERYYQALNTDDADLLAQVLAPDWVERGMSPSVADQDSETFLETVTGMTEGLDGGTFGVDAVYFADDVVTVRGTISGRHTGTILGVPPTGRDVSFGAIAVHRIADGVIVESWQMADWATLMRIITG